MNADLPADVEMPPDSRRLPGAAQELSRWTCAAVAGLLLLAAMVLWWRRVAGALSTPLDTAPMLLVAALLAAAAVSARSAEQSLAKRRPAGPFDRFVAVGLSAALVAIGAALSLPGTSAGGLVLFWGVLAVEEGWAWGPARRRRVGGVGRRWPAVRRRVARILRRAVSRADRPASSARPNPSPAPVPVLEAPGDEQVTQQLVRSTEADGSDRLSGWMRVPMASGQRSASVHMAFCPQFSRAPKVTVEQLEGPRARLKTVQVLPHGARVDLKLAGACEQRDSVVLRFSAQAEPIAADADAASPPAKPAADA